MTDIKLVVKIDADVYTRLFDNGIQDNEIATDDICEMARALRLGKPYEERKTGKWVDAWRYDRYQSGQGLCRYWYRKCSCCDYERDDCDPEKDTMFCPNCGAKMEVDE